MLSQQELITEKEVGEAVKVSYKPRDKALVAVLYESGCRISEVGTLCLENVAFDSSGVVLTVNGKTGSRRIRLVKSAQFLAAWINTHPLNGDPRARLWISLGSRSQFKPMSYQSLVKIVKTAFAKAGIKKKCNPHLFRHSRASVMANHLTEFQMNHYFGWKQGSMPATYVHLSGKELDSAILKMNGKVRELKQIEEPKVQKNILNKDIIGELIKNPAVQKMVIVKLLEM